MKICKLRHRWAAKRNKSHSGKSLSVLGNEVADNDSSIRGNGTWKIWPWNSAQYPWCLKQSPRWICFTLLTVSNVWWAASLPLYGGCSSSHPDLQVSTVTMNSSSASRFWQLPWFLLSFKYSPLILPKISFSLFHFHQVLQFPSWYFNPLLSPFFQWSFWFWG